MLARSIEKIAMAAKAASRLTALAPSRLKESALKSAARALAAAKEEVLAANRSDVGRAKKRKLAPALIDRLTLDAKRVGSMVLALEEIAALADPVGEVAAEWTNPAGVRIQKVRVPLGVVAMVYESRPNVTVEAAALALKAGNSVILRGGSEAVRSNTALARILSRAVSAAGMPRDSVSFISDTDRKNIAVLAGLDRWIDLLIARGSERMVRAITRMASVPVLGHGKGVCHVYVDGGADLKMAEEIAFNAKVQRPGVCNAMECLIVHKSVSKSFLPAIGRRYREAGVAVNGDEACRALIPEARRAAGSDWAREYLALEVSVKVVDSIERAIDHIHRYGSGHTDSIVTGDAAAAEKFLREVDSAAVFHNLSTRLHDGGVFGLGAEIGISTQKLHARGTMGVRELTTTKYAARGSGQVRT
ncbi:MAG: glutamate-5-semialdehyde dehydrogenase [Elusimicrobia bacterium RIFCSPHIGHO2_01_FULL_64_10]|nr:MAG: glutamate-5-semialdehyde dehydrogenase [Elusimicrobia bacterium RIFCSPHIGHO2_01_FULL_64_10]